MSDMTEATAQQRTDDELRNIAVHTCPEYRAAYSFLKGAASVQDQEHRITALHLSHGVVARAREIYEFLEGR